jgi:RNA polymerase sigma factor (sigma-70 family)
VSLRVLTGWLRDFRRTCAVREAAELTDRDLLRRFSHDRDEAAFSTLMQRHGPLVLGVCRRLLPDPNDADDAFQATFLVLARKAGSVGQPDRLANWLYGVALRVAKKARSASARRRGREEQLQDVPASVTNRDSDWNDLCQALDDEVQRLPEKFRLPIQCCYLEGKTREDAARELGWSAGAVKGMLERGRDRLRSRLIRRGVILSATSLEGLLAENARSATVPAALIETTKKAALLFVIGKAEGGSVVELAEGVLQVMGMRKLRAAVALVVVLCLVGTGAGVLALGRAAEEPEASKKADPAPKAAEKADPLPKTATGRRDLAKAAYEGYLLRFELGQEDEQTVNLWSRRWLQAQLDLSDKKADRDAALQAHRERLKKVDEIARSRVDFGASSKPLQSVSDEVKDHDTFMKQFMERQATVEQVCHASARLLMSQQVARKQLGAKGDNVEFAARLKESWGFDLSDNQSEYQGHLARMKKVEEITKARAEAGVYHSMDQDTATFYRLQAEEWLAQKKKFTEDVLNPGNP